MRNLRCGTAGIIYLSYSLVAVCLMNKMWLLLLQQEQKEKNTTKGRWAYERSGANCISRRFTQDGQVFVRESAMSCRENGVGIEKHASAKSCAAQNANLVRKFARASSSSSNDLSRALEEILLAHLKLRASCCHGRQSQNRECE